MKTIRLGLIWILLLVAAFPIGMSAQDSSTTSDFDKIKAKAAQGDAEAQFVMGYWCETKGSDHASFWWAIPSPDVTGGNFFNRDQTKFVEALSWYQKSADKGYAKAQFALGNSHLRGMGGTITPKPDEAVKWYRKAAEQGFADSQFYLGYCYHKGKGVPVDLIQAYKWYFIASTNGQAGAVRSISEITADMSPAQIAEAKKTTGITETQSRDFQSQADKNEFELSKQIAADENFPNRFEYQFQTGTCYALGKGVEKSETESVKWFRKAAEGGYADAQKMLGVIYSKGEILPQDESEAVKWFLKAANQGEVNSQYFLGLRYSRGQGVPKNDIEAYIWLSLAASQGDKDAPLDREIVAKRMSREEIVEAQRRASTFVPQKQVSSNSKSFILSDNPKFTGTGFFITDDGYLISNFHVVKGAIKVRLQTSAGLIDATVVKVDAANDLALLKAAGQFTPLPVAASRGMKLGATVATVGFPDTGLQGFSPKLAKGEIASLAGAADDPRYFQISVPVQPGNSGGALVEAHANVVGIVAAKLSARAALDATGALPENVNYAVKSSLLLSFLESVPDVASKLKEPNTKESSFEDVVKSAQAAAVLVLVY